MEQQLEMLRLPRRPRIQFGLSLVKRLARRAEQLTGLPANILTTTIRKRECAWARFAVMKVAWEEGRRISHISTFLRMDHSSVIYGIRRADELMHEDEDFAELVRLLREEVVTL